MTRRVRVLFEGEPPADAPQVVWIPDDTDLEELGRRMPGAVGYVDLDNGDLALLPGTLDDEAISAQVTGAPDAGGDAP